MGIVSTCHVQWLLIKEDSIYESSDNMVSHPDHYKAKNGLEVIDVIEAFTEGLNGIDAVDTGNAIKYICRWTNKNGIQDLEKAVWYLTHLIERKKLECEKAFLSMQNVNVATLELRK